MCSTPVSYTHLAMARFAMVIDTARCVGCMDCVVACKTENEVPEGFCRDWIATEVRGKFPTLSMEIRSERCNHCDRPPCVSCCPTGASHIEELGQVVLVEHDKCIGCKAVSYTHLDVYKRQARGHRGGAAAARRDRRRRRRLVPRRSAVWAS